jgi:broad specificity phosphatase PhoE
MKRKRMLEILEEWEYELYNEMSDKEVHQEYIQWFELTESDVNELSVNRKEAIDNLVKDYLEYRYQETNEELMELISLGK